jgi:hypothetical protein
MTKRKYRSKADWQDLIKQQARSGLNAATFCDQQSISPKTFYRQRKRLEGKSTGAVPAPFIKVEPRSIKSIPDQAEVVLHYRNSRVQLPVSTTPSWVAELLRKIRVRSSF